MLGRLVRCPMAPRTLWSRKCQLVSNCKGKSPKTLLLSFSFFFFYKKKNIYIVKKTGKNFQMIWLSDSSFRGSYLTIHQEANSSISFPVQNGKIKRKFFIFFFGLHETTHNDVYHYIEYEMTKWRVDSYY
jgi:hypothetical protein